MPTLEMVGALARRIVDNINLYGGAATIDHYVVIGSFSKKEMAERLNMAWKDGWKEWADSLRTIQDKTGPNIETSRNHFT